MDAQQSDDEENADKIDTTAAKYVDVVMAIDLNNPMFDSPPDAPDIWSPLKVALEYTYKICMDSIFHNNAMRNVGIMFVGSFIGQEEKPSSILEFKKFGPISQSFIIELDKIRQDPSELMLFCCDDFSDLSNNENNNHSLSASLIKEIYQQVSDIYHANDEENIKKYFLLLTNNDKPMDNVKSDRKLLDIIFENLQQNKIQTLVIPLASEFDYELFYKNYCSFWKPYTEINQWNRLLFSMVFGKRKESSTFIYLNNTENSNESIKFAISIYGSCKVAKLNRNVFQLVNSFTKTQIKTETTDVCKTYNLTVKPENIGKFVKILDKDIIFNENEDIGPKIAPGFHVLGFCDLDSVTFDYRYKPTYFLYPNDKELNNSSDFYWHLLESCYTLKKAIICQYLASKAQQIRNVALIPHSNKSDTSIDIDIQRGFYLIFLPYMDDKRTLNTVTISSFDSLDENVTDNLIDSMTFDFDYKMFMNDDIALKKRYLELLVFKKDPQTTIKIERTLDKTFVTSNYSLGAFGERFSLPAYKK